MEIIPAIMPTSKDDLNEKISQVAGLVDTIQLDLMDGIFVPDKTYIPTKFSASGWELDLMVKNASEKMKEWLVLRPKRIIFHVEAEDNLIIPNDIEVGLAISTITPIEKLFPFISQIDFVQCMGIEKIGFQGQSFDEKVFHQISRLRELYPKLIISVDGGVSLDTAPKLIKAGASRLVIGSAIFESQNIPEIIKKFKKLYAFR